jgi:hypothetical protein
VPLEDRVVTTDQLLAINGGDLGWLQLGPGILDRLDPLGFHVLVPEGHLHIAEADAVMACIAQLHTRTAGPMSVRVLVPHDVFARLPRAFDVLALVPAFGPVLVEDVEEWLERSTAGDDDDAS